MVRQLTEKVKWIRCFGIENYSCIWVASFLWNAFEKHCSVSRKASNQLQLATSFLYQLHWSRIIERNDLSIYEKGNLLTVADDFKRMTLTKQKKKHCFIWAFCAKVEHDYFGKLTDLTLYILKDRTWRQFIYLFYANTIYITCIYFLLARLLQREPY